LRSSSAATAGLGALLALSSCGALILEVTWLRWLRLLFGATAPATSATLVAVLAGGALGAALAAHQIPKNGRPLRAYGLLLWAGAACALLVPVGLAAGEPLAIASYASLGNHPLALTLTRFAIALGATLPASTLLGAAFPAMAAVLLDAGRDLGSRGTALYAVVLLGAAAGAVLAAFSLPALFGVGATYAAGVALIAAAGAVALASSRRIAPRRVGPVASADPGTSASTDTSSAGDREPGSGRIGERGRIAFAALSGFGTFALQVLLVRALSLVLDQSVYAFGSMTFTALTALAAGSLAISWLQRRTALRPESLLAGSLALAGLASAAAPTLLYVATGGLDATAWDAQHGVVASTLGLAVLVAGLPMLAGGGALPAVLALAGRAGGDRAPETHLGRLIAANILGAICGAVLVPFVLLNALPLWSGFLAVALLYAVAAIFVPLGMPRTRLRRDLVLALGWIALIGSANPLSLPPVRLHPGEELLWLDTSPAGAVAVVARNDERSIRIDNHYDLGGSADAHHQERQGHLAAVLQPEARQALWIGSATGISAGALASHPLSRLHLLELVPAVADAGARFFTRWNRGVHDDPRAQVVLDDARSYVRASDEHFDLVVGDLFVPWRAGAGSLYTREHFEAVRAHLGPDGVFVQWLPLYQLSTPAFESIAATFLDAFPSSALFRGDFFGRLPVVALVGYRGAPPTALAVAAAAKRLDDAGVGDRWVRDPVGVWSLYVGPLAAIAERLATAPRNTDDRPWVEFGAVPARTGGSPRLVGSHWLRMVEPVMRAAGFRDPVFPGLSPPAVRAARGGGMLQAAGVAWAEERPDRAARLLFAAARDLPPHLLDPARPDPSAADLWPDPPSRVAPPAPEDTP
jgi:spermidine synthase